MLRYLLICLMLFTGSAHAAADDFDALKKAAELGDLFSTMNVASLRSAPMGVADTFVHGRQFTVNWVVTLSVDRVVSFSGIARMARTVHAG